MQTFINHPLVIGTGAVGAVEVTEAIPSVSPTVDIIKIAIQLVIGIVSIFKLFKKEKPTPNN